MDLVIGGTGYIGERLLRRVDPADTRVLTRDPTKANKLGQAGYSAVVGDLLEPATLADACRDVQHVYHLAHLGFRQRTRGRKSYVDLETEGTRNLLAAVRDSGATQIIHLGILGTAREARGSLLRAKWRIEELLNNATVPATILRAGTVVGPGGYGFQTILDAVRRFPIVFYLGPGSQRDQPLWVEDMIRYLLAVRGQSWAFGRTFDCGGEILTYAEMVKQIAEVLGKRRVYVRIPPVLIRTLARILDRVLPFSPSLAAGAIEARIGDTVCGESSIRSFVSFQPLGFRDSVRRAVEELSC